MKIQITLLSIIALLFTNTMMAQDTNIMCDNSKEAAIDQALMISPKLDADQAKRDAATKKLLEESARISKETKLEREKITATARKKLSKKKDIKQ